MIVANTQDPAVAPALEVEAEEKIETPWRVILFDDDIHTFEDVILQLIRATSSIASACRACSARSSS